MSVAKPFSEAQRMLRICAICNYCNGFCPVFEVNVHHPPTAATLAHLAHLCHGCRNCFYACQYAPPHVFAVNLPRALAELRHQVYLDRVWPPAGRWLLDYPFAALLLALTSGWLLVLLAILVGTAFDLGAPMQTGFYRVLPWGLMSLIGALPLAWSGLALAIQWGRHWRSIRPPQARGLMRAWWRTLPAILSLSHLSGGGVGCNDRDAGFSQARRRLHQALFAGLAFCLAATLTAALYHHALGLSAPYPVLSLPVFFGTAGGVLVCAATLGFSWLGLTGDPEPRAPRASHLDLAFAALLLIVAASGLALLLGRASAWMPGLLAIHLSSVWALFALLPYSKFLHAGYRALALLQESLTEHETRGD
ncbi:tricarballylate utilization 4Fe-4S protein TcuB [Caldichromatium japonicum]|uniref:Tricarballylate utilization 4Fe-4S protein TcuB n=1 Tax=Caldichromatium japonicum TaxID=2699430 RepID=A0A6G7VCT1_9GAMM|nr:tricarballylate utilization 4Fe-4S protein TcuB [Caldichromatium japonicum]QIK37597.1 tricarballylate utilization 4Fe-4S protein TcuB [Caldichromatium japonicum]